MKIALCSIGSRGDIQPFLVIGEYLAAQGHEVRVSSAKMYVTLASNYKVDYVSFEGDYAAIVDDEAMKKEIGKNPFTIGKNLKEKVYPILENSLDTFYELLQWSDVILYHPKTLMDSIGNEMKHKLIKTYVVPAFTPTKEFTNPLLEFLPVPRFLNKLTYKFANAMLGTVKTPVNNFRKRNFLPKSKMFLDTPIIYGISPSFISRPEDYPDDHYFTGFWMKQQINQELSEEVKDFITDDKEVLIITFGSMPYQSKTSILDFVNAILEKNDIKILIVKAWGLKDVLINNSEKILAIDSTPFDLLFPLADYVIHHGGAGTTAIALKAGIPQMICPVLHPFGDQAFWGNQINKMGVGVKPIPLKKLTINNLLDNVSKLRNKNLKIEAKKLKGKIELEDGLLKTKEIVEEHYKKHCV